MQRCCKDPSKYHIVFDIGLQTSEWTVCEKHYHDDLLFQKNIKSKNVMEN